MGLFIKCKENKLSQGWKSQNDIRKRQRQQKKISIFSFHPVFSFERLFWTRWESAVNGLSPFGFSFSKQTIKFYKCGSYFVWKASCFVFRLPSRSAGEVLRRGFLSELPQIASLMSLIVDRVAWVRCVCTGKAGRRTLPHWALPPWLFLDTSTLGSWLPQASPSLSVPLSSSPSSSSSSSSGEGSLPFSVAQLSSSSSCSFFIVSRAGGGAGSSSSGFFSVDSVWSSKASGFSSISRMRGGMGPGISILRVMALSAPVAQKQLISGRCRLRYT